MPKDAGNPVFNIAVSQDKKRVVSGTGSGRVAVWTVESYSLVKVIQLKAHDDCVQAVDVSPDGTKIATGSRDKTLCVWSLSTGRHLLGPLNHNAHVVAVKFSPNGRLIATATYNRDVRVYDGLNGGLHGDFQIQVYSTSLAWASDSKQLIALSRDGHVHCLDVFTGTTLLKWAIHSSDNARCIALAGNDTFIAVSANSSVSFWDTATREQIGSVIEHTHDIWSMAISSNYDVVIAGHNRITLRGLCHILPSRYFHHVCVSA